MRDVSTLENTAGKVVGMALPAHAAPLDMDRSRIDAAVAREGLQESYLQSIFAVAGDRVFAAGSRGAKEFKRYGPEFVRTLSLFAPGRAAFCAHVLISGADRVTPNLDATDDLVNFALGAAQGATSKLLFARWIKAAPFPRSACPALTTGLALGITSRAIELATRKQTYLDPTGDFSAGTGMKRLIQGSLNRHAVMLDVGLFMLAEGAGLAAGSLTTSLSKRPHLISAITGFAYGAVGGALEELSRQRQEGGGIGPGEVAARCAMRGAVDGLSAGIAGAIGRSPYERTQRVNLKINDGDRLRFLWQSGRVSGSGTVVIFQPCTLEVSVPPGKTMRLVVQGWWCPALEGCS